MNQKTSKDGLKKTNTKMLNIIVIIIVVVIGSLVAAMGVMAYLDVKNDEKLIAQDERVLKNSLSQIVTIIDDTRLVNPSVLEETIFLGFELPTAENDSASNIKKAKEVETKKMSQIICDSKIVNNLLYTSTHIKESWNFLGIVKNLPAHNTYQMSLFYKNKGEDNILFALNFDKSNCLPIEEEK